jgi:CubicO group peptidase (beta-lactamase class C family)
MDHKAPLALVCLALAATASAEDAKRTIVNHGGPPDLTELTANWPKAAVRDGMSEADRAAALGGLLAALVEKDLFSGVVEVARGGKPVYRGAVGLASREWNVPNRPETLFNIGSIDKTFTQLAIKLLEKDGALSLGDTVAKLRPDYKGDGADRITVRQLLNQTSGMGDIFDDVWTKTPRNRIRSLEDYRPLFESAPLQFEPGTSSSYSNAGYVLLGLVIEKVSGKPYETFVKERVLAPLGMKSTGFSESDAVVPNRATGYTRRGPTAPFETLHANIHALPGKPSSAGGGDSTADDLVAFGEALRRNAFDVGSPHPEGGIGVAGGFPGANAVLEVCGGGITIVALANVDPPAAEYVAGEARRLYGCAGPH